MTQQLCGALSEAHQKHVIHRDIKPSNIIISRRPGSGLNARLIDFGLVKNVDQTHGLSQSGSMLGTPMYMAPEQIKATGVDDRIDIYALGLTPYSALTGKEPQPNRAINSLIHAQLSEELDEPALHNEHIPAHHMLNWIVHTAVAKDPDQRFQSTLQILEALKVCQDNLERSESPLLELSNGKLISLFATINIDATIPQKPLVEKGSYVQDGCGISDGFAETLHLSLNQEQTNETFLGFEHISNAMDPVETSTLFILLLE